MCPYAAQTKHVAINFMQQNLKYKTALGVTDQDKIQLNLHGL